MSESRITIVTPVYNAVDYVEETICSVLDQNYSNLDYIIIDGGSNDGTVDIIKKYERYLSGWVSEEDNGVYDALNKGFAQSTGSLMGWINADDILLPNCLKAVNRIFADLPRVDWIQGLHGFIDLTGALIEMHSGRKITKMRMLQGDFKWIQQESCFWRKDLWAQAGGELNITYQVAADFDLWFRFMKYAKLYYVNLPLGAWRKRPGQLSDQYFDKYISEVQSIIKRYPKTKKEVSELDRILELKHKRSRKLWSSTVKAKRLDQEIRRLEEIDLYSIGFDHSKQCFSVKQ